MDRDTKFSDAFRKILEDEGVESVRLLPRSPNLNPHLERFMRSVKEEARVNAAEVAGSKIAAEPRGASKANS